MINHKSTQNDTPSVISRIASVRGGNTAQASPRQGFAYSSVYKSKNVPVGTIRANEVSHNLPVQFRDFSVQVQASRLLAPVPMPEVRILESVYESSFEDPITKVLSYFDAIPREDYDGVFSDFAKAVDERNFAQLVHTIADWAATAEIYSHGDMMDDVVAARDAYLENLGWQNGE